MVYKVELLLAHEMIEFFYYKVACHPLKLSSSYLFKGNKYQIT